MRINPVTGSVEYSIAGLRGIYDGIDWAPFGTNGILFVGDLATRQVWSGNAMAYPSPAGQIPNNWSKSFDLSGCSNQIAGMARDPIEGGWAIATLQGDVLVVR